MPDRLIATIAPVLFGLAAGLCVPAAAQDSFPGEFDPVQALTIVYGRAPWDDSQATRFNTFENGQDFIEPLFDAAFVENGSDKHIVIATLTPRPRSQHSCHACSPMLGGAVFRRDGEAWRIEAVGQEIEQGHAWFDARHGRLQLVRIGPGRYGLLHQIDDVSGGYETMQASLIVGLDGVLASRLVVPPFSGPGPGACGVPEQHLAVTIVDDGADDAAVVATAAQADADYFEVVVDALWNEARCESVDGGIGARSSGRACQRITRYRFRDGVYEVANTELGACTVLPERTVFFRG
jgi:hypothetical protein